MSDMQTASPIEPVLVGRYPVPDGQAFLPLGARELRGIGWFWQDILETARFPAGANILLAATMDQAAQLYPLELAAADLNLVICSAEPSFFDAGRVESILRRFAPVAIVGVGAAMLEGLRAGGHDPATLFGGMTAWVWPDAYDAVAAMSGVTALRLAEVGPVIAVECARGKGAHFDGREWAIEATDSGLSVSSRLPRALAFDRMPIESPAGRVDASPCACGLSSPRILFA